MEAGEVVLQQVAKLTSKKHLSPHNTLVELAIDQHQFERLILTLERELRIPVLIDYSPKVTVADIQQYVKTALRKFRPPTSWDVYH